MWIGPSAAPPILLPRRRASRAGKALSMDLETTRGRKDHESSTLLVFSALPSSAIENQKKQELLTQSVCLSSCQWLVYDLAPTHVALNDEERNVSVDFNVGKSDRSGMKVTGKRKKNLTWTITISI